MSSSTEASSVAENVGGIGQRYSRALGRSGVLARLASVVDPSGKRHTLDMMTLSRMVENV